MIRIITTMLLFSFTSIHAVDKPFITGNEFRALCRYSFDERGLRINHKVHNDYYFVKTPFVEEFFERFCPEDEFIMVSHDSDNGVTIDFLPYIELPQIIHWYGQNLEISHPKLTGIPIGLCNFGDHATLRKTQKRNLPKTRLVYANYCVRNNPKERGACSEKTKIPNSIRLPYYQYIREMAQSYFVLSPNGNGIDCHRTWEALYLRAIPIVTRSPTTESFAHLPIIILDSWDDFKDLDLTPELYYELWGDFDPDSLTAEAFIPLIVP